jgi:oxaloacetate decarboxylase gamma subunit
MPDIMLEALDLALYGMGTVFIFLTVLVGLTTLMSKFALYLDRLNPPAATPGKAPLKAVGGQAGEPSPALLAAITAAVKQYRERH